MESCAPASSRVRKPIVVWNITRTCNLKCVHCYADASARKFDGELDWDQCCTVIDDLADYKVNALLFSGGEPLVHPRFMDLLERATGKGMKVTISTNGTRITPESAARFKELGVAYVGISLDGIGAVHDQFRGVEGSFDQAVRGFKLCSDVGQKTGLRLTLTRNNVQCMEQILDFIDANDIQRVCFYHLVPTGRGVEVQTLTREEARHAMDTLIARVEEWKAKGKNREVLTVTQPADGIYLLLRQLREGSPLAEETLKLLQWNGGGAEQFRPRHCQHRHAGHGASGSVLAVRDARQREKQPVLRLVGRQGGSRGGNAARIARVRRPLERQKKIEGRCGRCVHFALCGGGFRTRAAFANGHWYGSDPGCYLTEEEISTPLPEIK